jgi:hypothetical protein
MITHDDRILHYALQKVLSEEEAVDLAPAVVEAWERGEVGTYEPGEVEAPGAAVPAPARRLWPRWAAAASVLAAGAALTFLVRGPAEPTVTHAPLAYATASDPLEVLSPNAPVFSSTTLAIGDRVRVPAGRGAVDVRFASGGLVSAQPGAIFAVGQDRGEVEVKLDLGSLRVRRGSGPALIVDTGFARLAPDPWASLYLTVQSDDAALADSPPATTTEIVARGEDLHRALLVELRAGAAQLEYEGEAFELFENDALALRDDREFAGSMLAADAEWMLGLCQRAAPFEELTAKMPDAAVAGSVDLAEGDADLASAELFAYLEGRPDRWAALQPALFEFLAAEPDWYVRDVLQVIVRSDTPGARRLARALWRREPKRFAEDHVIALAAAHVFEFEREVRAAVDSYVWGDEFFPVRSAAHLISLGDQRGLALIEDAAQAVPVDQRSMNDVFVATLALDHLGRPDAWLATREAMASQGIYALQRGDEPAARSIAVTLDLVEELRGRGEPVPVAFFEEHVARHLQRRKDQVSTYDAILESLKRW